jgi:tetratricopeptide (TPR) repeat protein
LAVTSACVFAVIIGTAVGAGSASDETSIPNWLVAGDPVDETIRDYWERADRGELDADSLVDLGTLIFDRGHPDEAIVFYKQALKVDSEMYEAWFRIGLVEHTRGDLDNAEQAYSRCLKKRPGHAWCNFYYGLLEEQLGHPTKALKRYEQAFRKAPRLADPAFNPEVRSSRLALGARLTTYDEERFEEQMPMRLLRPDLVNEVLRSYEPSPVEDPSPEAEPEATEPAASAAPPVAQPTPAAASPKPRPAPPARRVPTRPAATPVPTSPEPEGSGGETPFGAPMAPIANTSDEAHLRPAGSALWRVSERLV